MLRGGLRTRCVAGRCVAIWHDRCRGQASWPDVEREVTAFRIMDWRDGLMGIAMVTMMVLRPAGIIPERRQAW